jgi:predicted RNA methylase
MEADSTCGCCRLSETVFYLPAHITFCINGGMDAKDLAKLIGNSPEIIYRHYTGAKRNLVASGF